MNEFLSSSQEITSNKYTRLMIIVCLDTLINLPVLVTVFVSSILQGDDNALNFPYVSWKNVHDGAGGNLPGITLGSIIQVPASEWSTDGWSVFSTKWDEWLYVIHAVIFFCVFGTTSEMRRYYRRVFWLMPERLGYKGPDTSVERTLPEIAFNCISDRPAQKHPLGHR